METDLKPVHDHKQTEDPYFCLTLCTITCPRCLHHRLAWNSCLGDDPLTHLCVDPNEDPPKLVIRSGGVIVEEA